MHINPNKKFIQIFSAIFLKFSGERCSPTTLTDKLPLLMIIYTATTKTEVP